MAREIPRSRGMVAIVDDDDHERLSAHQWSVKPAAQAAERWYAYRTEGRRTVYMHREIMGAGPSDLVDHRDNDGLNNRRANLRLATHGQNNVNRDCALGASGYRGVHPHGEHFRAMIEVDGLVIRISGHLSAEEAARAYDAVAREFHGEFARLNFPAPRAA